MLAFLLSFFRISTLLGIVMLIALVFQCFFGVEFSNADVLKRPRWVEHIISDRVILMTIMWIILIATASVAEALKPLEENYFTRSDLTNPRLSAAATVLCFVLTFWCACELVRVFLVPLRIRMLTTRALNEGK